MKEVVMKHLRVKGIIIALLIIAALGAVFVLTAGKDKETAMEGPMEITEPTSEVTLNWWFQDWAGGVGWMNDYIAVFEGNHPNIDVNLIPVPFNDLYAKLIPSISQGNEPEILYGYDEWLVGKDVKGLFYPLTPTIMSVSEFKEHIYEAPLKNVTGSDGNFYGMPWATGANAFGFVYHKDLFREAGIDASDIKSWDDIKAAAKKLTKYNADGSIQRSGVLFSYTEAANAFLDMIQMQGARNKMFDQSALQWNFNIPEATRAMETFQWFVDNNVYDPEAGDPFTTFPNKIGAMLLIGPWNVGLAMTQFPELEVGYILMPPYPKAGDDLVLGSIVSYGALFVSRRVEGDTRNAALIFIRDIMTRPTELYDIPFYHEPPYWVGAVCNKKYIDELMSRSDSEMNEFAQTCLTATNKGLPAVNVLETRISEPIIIRQVIHPEMESVFLGKKSIDEMMEYLTSYLTQQEKQLAE
jgi:ABC-type glycerol-3-phosphate transport system substrate-binding protein